MEEHDHSIVRFTQEEQSKMADVADVGLEIEQICELESPRAQSSPPEWRQGKEHWCIVPATAK